MMRTIFTLAAVAALATGCARNLDGATYTSGNTVGKVTYGTVVSARGVTVKDHDKLQDNTAGGLAGGVVGGVAGSAFGGGTGNSLATVGGAVLGAVAGAYAQDQLSTQSAYEYIVQLDSPRHSTHTMREEYTFKGRDSIADELNDSVHTAQTQSEAISIVQSDEVMLQPGTRVMIVYNDDRPRVIPAR